MTVSEIRSLDSQVSQGATWTIDHAFTILLESDDPSTLESLDKFLEINKPLWKQSVPFALAEKDKVDASTVLGKFSKDFSLRTIKYTINEENKKDAIKVSNLLKIDPLELLRIISQLSMRVPDEKKTIGYLNNGLHGLNADISDIYESERVQLYCDTILRERRSILKLITLLLQNKNNEFVSETIQRLGQELSDDQSFITNSITSFEQLIDDIVNQEYLTNTSKELDEVIASEYYLLIIDFLKVLINLFINNIVDKKLVHQWFKFTTKTNFLSSISRTIPDDTAATISALATMATLLLIDLENNFGSLTDDTSYMNDGHILLDITNSLLNSPTNSLVIYAWSFILHRKSIVLEEFPSNPKAIEILSSFENLLELQYMYKAFALKADSMEVCELIKQCHEILKFDSMYTAMLGSYVISMLPYIELIPKVASLIETVLSDAPEHVVKKFFSDENSERLIILARAKMPMSLSSYIKICNINGVFAYEEFTILKSYMESFNELDLFNKYEFDEFNPELVRFNENIDIFPPYEQGGELSLLLEKGIKGKLIPTDDDNQQIVIFLYQYNGLSLIGRILQNLLKIYDVNDLAKTELMIDILKLITRILDQCPKATQEDAIAVMSAFVDQQDIYKVIFEIFNKALAERNVSVLVPLVELLTASLESFSDKVWNFLKDSTFLENGTKGGAIAVILGSLEIVHGNYDFSIAVIELCNGLVSNCLNVNNKSELALRSEVLKKLVVHLIQIFESFSHWRYTHLYQKLKIGTLISDIFARILIATYGIGEDTKVHDKPTKVFGPSSEKIVESFLTPTIKEVRSNRPITLMIESVATALLPYQTTDTLGMWYENWIRSCFEFSALLITTRSIIGLKPSSFEESIFSQAQNLVEIYAKYVALRKYVIKLLTSLVSAKWPNEPPSLLAHLGNYHANMLIKSMSNDLNNTFDDAQMKVLVYDFFAAVMDGNSQEGLSIMFITGRDIRELVNSKDKEKVKSTSILSILKKHISQIYDYPDSVGLHLVEAIALAFNSWTTAKEDDNDIEFIRELVKRVKTTSNSTIDLDASPEEFITVSYEFKLISKITEILALYLFVSKNQDCIKEIESLVEDTQFMQSMGNYFKITGYQPLLHSNLHKKFETKWPGYKLLQFVKSALVKTRRYGVGSVYDISLMDELFKQEEEWEAYRSDIASASINLRYIESQLIVAKSFGALISSYCNRVKKPIGTSFLKLVGKLLELSEGDDNNTAPIFGEIFQERIELAFFITFKSSTHVVDDDILYPVLNSCCKILISNDLDLIAGFTDGDTAKYKPLLRTLLAALKLIKPSTKLLENHPELFHDLFRYIIARSLNYLCSSVVLEALTTFHKESRNISIANKRLGDFSLILSILKVFVKLNLPSSLKTDIAKSLMEHGLIRSILGLYVSSNLIKVNNEAVFANIALSIIYELITVKEIAEEFLSNGLFLFLMESPISEAIQEGNIKPGVTSNYHHVWTNGLLPIILTLLSTFGEKVLPDTVMIVTYFIEQIETNLNTWYQDSIVITNALIQETSQIILIYKILQALDVNEYFSSYDNNYAVSENGDIRFIPGLDNSEQRQGLVNVFNYLLSHPKFLSLRIAPVTVEENRLFEKDEKAFFDLIVEEIKELKNSLID